MVLVGIGYVLMTTAWAVLDQDIEEVIGYTFWALSLPALSIGVGFLLPRAWAIALAVVPALVTVPEWGNGCGGDDVCFGNVVAVIVVLCAAAIGTGVLLRRAGSAARA